MDIKKLLNEIFAEYNFNSLKNIIRQLDTVPYIPYPVAFHTVDVFVLRDFNGTIQVLLGRKKGHNLFQCIGGFVDPGETAEHAAMRETFEETDLTIQYQLDIFRKDYGPAITYLGSKVISDERYANSPHKITSSVYCYFIEQGESEKAVGKDDIEEVKWFNLVDFKTDMEIIRPLHRELVYLLLTYLHDDL